MSSGNPVGAFFFHVHIRGKEEKEVERESLNATTPSMNAFVKAFIVTMAAATAVQT